MTFQVGHLAKDVAGGSTTPWYAGRARAAQDHPTERGAARDVLRKMAELEKSIDVPTLVERIMANNPARDQVVARSRELMEKELLAMSDDITRHPEIGFEETRSIEKLVSYLKAHGFEVTIGAANMKTAFVARYKGKTASSNSGPNLGVILEYDALRGTTRPFMATSTARKDPSESRLQSRSPKPWSAHTRPARSRFSELRVKK